MKILVDNLHIPYSYDLLRALNGVGELYHCTWTHDAPGKVSVPGFRPRLPYVRIIEREDAIHEEWDVLITDTGDRTLLDHSVLARKKVAIFHLERHAPPSNELDAFVKQFDAIVTPSENKTGTWMDYPYRYRFVTIPLAVDGDDYPAKEDYSSVIVGTSVNSVTQRSGCLYNWIRLSRPFDQKLVIGGDNSSFEVGCPVTNVLDWDSYRESLRSLGVFVHIVEGNETGMAVREAMASGVPVVTGVMPELYWFAYPGYDICMSRGACSLTTDYLIEWIHVLLNNQSEREKIGRNGRRAILRAYPMATFRRQWRELIESL